MGSVYALAVGAMMGSGVFILPGLAASIAGPWVALSYMIAGVLVLPAVLSKAEMATAMPVAGGTYVYVDRSMGPWMGTITGLGTWIALSSKTALGMVGLVGYLVLFTEIRVEIASLVVLTALTGINIAGAGKAAGLQKAIVGFTILALITFMWVASRSVEVSNLSPMMPTGFAGVMAGAGFVFNSYAGVTKVCSVAEEIRDPARNIPLAMLLAQFSVMILYVIMAVVITGNLPWDSMGSDVTPVASVALHMGGRRAQLVMASIAIIGLVSMCNAGVLATTRFPFAMSRDSLLPARFGAIHKVFGTPVQAIVLTWALLVCLVLFFPVIKLAKIASGFKLFIFCIVNLAVIVLRETNARWYKPTFRSPLYPWTQIVGILGGLYLLFSLGSLAIWGVLATIMFGTAWYFGYAKKRVSRRSAFAHLWGEAHTLKATLRAEALEGAGPFKKRVTVPVFGNEPAPERLVRLAAAFGKGGVLEVIRLEEVPSQAQLTDFLDADESTRRLAEDSVEIGEDVHVEVEFKDVVTHNAMQAVTHHVLAVDSDWVVLEWPSRTRLQSLVRNPLAWWIDNLSADLAIFLDRGGAYDGDTANDYPRILVLAEPGPYDSMVVHAADRLARGQQNGHITLYEPMSPNATEEDIQQHAAYHQQLGSLCRSPWTSQIQRVQNTYEAIADFTKDFDLLVMGAGPERPLYSLFFGSHAMRVADAATCSVLKVKAPRHKVHNRFAFADDETGKNLRIEPHIKNAIVAQGVPASRKQILFSEMSKYISYNLNISEEDVLRALLSRERKQNTALPNGVAITASLLNGIENTQLCIFTTRRVIDFHAPHGRPVDVVMVVLSPPGDRKNQLWLLDRLSELVKSPEMLSNIRTARTAEAIRNAIREAEALSSDS